MKRVPLFVWLVTGALGIFWLVLGSYLLPAARQHDFLNLYTGASLALEGRFADLHSVDVQLERERLLYPQLESVVPFVRPSFYALMLAPMALLPPALAFNCWIALQMALLLGSFVWAFRRFGPDALVFGALFLPPPLGIASGQDCVEMLAIFILAYELAGRERFFRAGAVLALLLIKFHLVLLWPVALILQRRWRMLGGFCLIGFLEVMVSVGLGGLQGARNYIALLQNKDLDRLSPSPEFMISIQGLLGNLDIESPALMLAIAAVVFVVFAAVISRASLPQLFALTSFASLFLVPHVYAYDATLLLLPSWLLIFHGTQPLTRIAATLFSTPVPFLFSLADKPYSIISSVSLGIILVVTVRETILGNRAIQPGVEAHSG